MESRMRLVAAAGHDLRTPLTRLRLRAAFLPEQEREVWLRDLNELDQIAGSAIRLVREEADDAPFETVPLAAVAGGIAAEIAGIGLKAALDVEADTPVRAQPPALKRALRNLIENAALHGGGAVVRVSRAEERGAVTIGDRGPGIPEHLLGRVFEPVFRVDAGRQKLHAGAGLGLAIARETVGRQRGTAVIRDREGGGLLQRVGIPHAGGT